MRALASEEDTDEPRVTRVESLDDRVAVLRSVANSITANIEKIETWRGSFFLQDRLYLEEKNARLLLDVLGADPATVTGPVVRRDVGTILFAYDAMSDRVFTTYELTAPMVFQDESTGRPIYTTENTPVRRSILTPEHFLHMDPTLEYGRLKLAPDILPTQGPVATREEISKAKEEQFATVVDPRLLFDCGIPIAQFFDHMISALTEGETRDGVLTDEEAQLARRFVMIKRIEPQEGNDLIYRISVGPISERGANQVQTLTVKRSSGFNVVQVTIFDGNRLVSQLDWRFREQSGVFLPEYYRKMSSTMDGEHMAAERILELRESILNEPIPESTFSYANLGLKDGDRLEDLIENKVYVLREGKLVAPVVARQSIADAGNQSLRYALIIANIVVILAILLFVLRRRLAA